MKFKVRHLTRYTYDAAVSDCQNTAVLLPRASRWQQVQRAALSVVPEPNWAQERSDWVGNRIVDFSVETLHEALEVVADSAVEVIVPSLPLWDDTPSWERVAAYQDAQELLDIYRLPSALVPEATEAMRAYAASSFAPDRPVISAVMDLTSRLFNDFAYVPGSTEVSTPVSEMFQSRMGVCQDFAHLGLTLLRALGLPTRYVSGYLETQPPEGQPRLVGADASHAWFSVFVQGLGWVDFDPTNNQMPSDRHITVAWGRDYADVVPVKGFTAGGGNQRLHVAVDVVADEESRQQSWF